MPAALVVRDREQRDRRARAQHRRAVRRRVQHARGHERPAQHERGVQADAPRGQRPLGLVARVLRGVERLVRHRELQEVQPDPEEHVGHAP